MKFDNVKRITADARRVELPLGDKVIGFTVEHFDARAVGYTRIRDKLAKPVRKLVEADLLPKERDREIAVRAFVKYCVRGWDGITSEGQSVPFSEENCVAFLTQSPQTFYALIDEAGERDNFTEEDAGNF